MADAPDSRPTDPAVELVAFIHGSKLRFALPAQGRVTIGRSESNDVRLFHHSVSRRHLLVECREGEVWIEDVGSRNGTRVFSGTHGVDTGRSRAGEETHGAPSEWRVDAGAPRRVRQGDMIRVGSVMVRLQEIASPSEQSVDREEAIVVDETTRKVYELAKRVAQSDLSVLILGETGVGKDVLAQFIHENSHRSRAPFVRIHCAALAQTLLESELFGHVKGAFTGAVHAKTGLIEAARGGTVFLDELGEMSESTQVKLLNVLETGEVTPVGGTKPVDIDVRFVAATNRNLPEWVNEGRFRRDLFFRINALTLTVPPLRERPRDIEPLARRFARLAASRGGTKEPVLTPECLEQLTRRPWPGNVRELKNVIDRAVVLSVDGALSIDDLAVDFAALSPLDLESEEENTTLLERPAIASSRAAFGRGETRTEPRAHRDDVRVAAMGSKKDRIEIQRALDACSGNQTRAAELLGISRRTLINWLDELGMPRPRKR